jgi:hypothetical protein
MSRERELERERDLLLGRASEFAAECIARRRAKACVSPRPTFETLPPAEDLDAIPADDEGCDD